MLHDYLDEYFYVGREVDFMKWAWEKWSTLSKGNVKCTECGKHVKFHPNHVGHLLSKGSHRMFRTLYHNVLPFCYGCHQLLDHGSGQKTKKDMKKWEILEDRIFKLKRLYTKLMK